MTKLVSIIIPTYKRSDSLLETIDSVLKQTYSAIEIIVVDDNGLGNEFQKATQCKLQNLIDENKIIYIPHKVNKNGSSARNTGFRASRGEYVNFLDDDDILMPEKIERQVKFLETQSSGIGATYCNSQLKFRTRFSGRIKIINTNYAAEGNLIREYLENEMHFNTSSLLFRRSVIEELHGFDESYRRHQDYELLLRYFKKWKIKCTPGPSLLLFDMLKDRGNVPNLDNLIAIKTKFLEQFKQELVNWNLWNEINHNWWLICGIQAIDKKRFALGKKLLVKASRFKSYNSYEYIAVVKALLRTAIKFYKH